MANLRRLSMADLRELRQIILTVINEGDIDQQQWVLYPHGNPLSGTDWTEVDAERERGLFCDAIQQRIFATAVARKPEPIDEEYKQATPEVAALIFRWANGRRLVDAEGRVVSHLIQSADGETCVAQFDGNDVEWYTIKPDELSEPLPERKGGGTDA